MTNTAQHKATDCPACRAVKVCYEFAGVSLCADCHIDELAAATGFSAETIKAHNIVVFE